MANIAAMFPVGVSIVRRGGRWRSQLCFCNGLIVAVLIARSVRVWKGTTRWQIDPVAHESSYVTLVARLDPENKRFYDFHVVPSIDRPKRFYIRETDPWLQRGFRLSQLSDFHAVVLKIPS